MWKYWQSKTGETVFLAFLHSSHLWLLLSNSLRPQICPPSKPWGMCPILRLQCSHPDLQWMPPSLHHLQQSSYCMDFFFFYEGIKLQKLCLFNIYSNIYKMVHVKSKNNNTFILRMHANSALSSIQSPLGRRWENRWEVSWLASRPCWESLWAQETFFHLVQDFF